MEGVEGSKTSMIGYMSLYIIIIMVTVLLKPLKEDDLSTKDTKGACLHCVHCHEVLT